MGEKEQTNEQYIWVNSKCKKRGYVTLCIPLCICRLTLAWISSEISTKLLGMPTHLERSSFTALDSRSCRLVTSAVRCPGHSRHPSPTAFSEFLCPIPTRVPLPTSGRVEISSPKPFGRFRVKTDKGIVCLVDYLHSVTIGSCRQTNYLFNLIYFISVCLSVCLSLSLKFEVVIDYQINIRIYQILNTFSFFNQLYVFL